MRVFSVAAPRADWRDRNPLTVAVSAFANDTPVGDQTQLTYFPLANRAALIEHIGMRVDMLETAAPGAFVQAVLRLDIPVLGTLRIARLSLAHQMGPGEYVFGPIAPITLQEGTTLILERNGGVGGVLCDFHYDIFGVEYDA